MYAETKNSWLERNFLVGNSAFVVAMVIWYFFPNQANPVYSFLAYLTFLVAFPLLVIRFILKRPLQDFGFGWGEWKQGILWAVLGWGVFIGLLAGVAKLIPSLNFSGIVPVELHTSFSFFLIFISITAVLFLGTEVLFRGFFLTIWREHLNSWGAVLVQSVLFWAWLATQGTLSSPEKICLIGVLPLWTGWLAIRTRSIWPGFLFLFGASILLSSFSLIFF